MRSYSFILTCVIVIFTGMGLYLGSYQVNSVTPTPKVLAKIEGSFEIKKPVKQEPKVMKKVKPKRLPKKKPKPIVKASLKKKEETKVVTSKKVRRIYGLKKLYSRGLGKEGPSSDAIVSKLGNSISGPVDTLKATESDLEGRLSSVTKVSKMPAIQSSIKPEYTDEMKKAQVEGKVKAKVLVDADGKVKRIIILKHLGYGTKDSSLKAIKKMKFSPGEIDGEAVAVWIPMTFRFELQV